MAGTESRQSGHRDQGRRLASRLLLGLCHQGSTPSWPCIFELRRIDLDAITQRPPKRSTHRGILRFRRRGLRIGRIGHYVKLSPRVTSCGAKQFRMARFPDTARVIFGLHMSDKKTVRSWPVCSFPIWLRIQEFGEASRCGPRCRESRVNAILYGRKSVFVPEGGSPPQCRLPSWSSLRIGVSSHTIKRDLEEPVVSQSEALSNVV